MSAKSLFGFRIFLLHFCQEAGLLPDSKAIDYSRAVDNMATNLGTHIKTPAISISTIINAIPIFIFVHIQHESVD
jgi:hypothetical protein